MTRQRQIPPLPRGPLSQETPSPEVRREAALLKAGALQNAILNSANFSSIATDEKGIIQLFNVGAEHMLGYTALEVVDRIAPADISDPGEVVARAHALSLELATPIEPGFEALVFKASRGIEDIYELTYIRKDGSRFPAVVSVTALRDAQGGIIGYLLIGTDNTARKQAEAAQQLLNQRLRDQQFRTRFLTEFSIDALMTTDRWGIITDVNQKMEALVACSRDELIGAPFGNYFTDADRTGKSVGRLLSGDSGVGYELTARAQDGKETMVSCTATAFHDRDSGLQGVFLTARDVTDLKRLERSLEAKNVELERARAAAEKASLAKSEFLTDMSHDLRAPLNTILGFAQLIDSDIPPPTLAQTASVEQILRSGWHLLELINEIVDLSQIESGNLALSMEPTSLTEVLRECEAVMVPQGRKRGIGMTFPPFGIPHFVRADRTRLKQVLISLLSNAIKYNQLDGTVVVDCAVSTSVSTPERIRVSVSDTGAGLSPDRMLRLFEPFNRSRQERSEEQGPAIGLAMSKRLVELMGGAIGVESNVGSGSVFWFELNSAAEPRLEPDGAHSAIVEGPVRHGAPVRSTVLYVEDNPANLELIRQIVARSPNISLLTAEDGPEGIQLARSRQPDVIFMDINLPGISGIEALKILRADPAIGHTPVIALSANAMLADIEKGLKAGFFRYLSKPIKVKEFMETLEVALEFAALGRGHSSVAGKRRG
jgi:PAS domain S-box-containing protein